ncbi:unnamed protein product [Pseudo-nitzschia multistriata]|uniref:Uncharacterized protein n=1 Tax=Pseudo-nitzschia multistriata TaxID=183589 RepID=A0A448Z2M1_9STRA|nr:unnamed protein product [Pseudo-nitzschia multistriata]
MTPAASLLRTWDRIECFWASSAWSVYRSTAQVSARRLAIVLMPVRTSEANAPAAENSDRALPEDLRMKQLTIPMAMPITGRTQSIKIARGGSNPIDTSKHPIADNKLAKVSATARPRAVWMRESAFVARTGSSCGSPPPVVSNQAASWRRALLTKAFRMRSVWFSPT